MSPLARSWGFHVLTHSDDDDDDDNDDDDDDNNDDDDTDAFGALL